MISKYNKKRTEAILPCITKPELRALNLKKGDRVQLTNGKHYEVVCYYARKSRLQLYSSEYGKKFMADHHIIHSKCEPSKPMKR